MSLFICGTDTGIGKTHVSAALLRRFADVPGLRYWKPVQTGFPPDDDRAIVGTLTGLPDERLAPTGISYREPLSPHRAAELEDRPAPGVSDLLPILKELEQAGPLIVEGAGGLLVPLNRKETWADFLQAAPMPVVLAARSGLGTINHSLLTISEMRRREIELAGIIFCGPPNEDNRRTVLETSGVPCLGEFDYRGESGDLDFEIPGEAGLRDLLTR